MKFSGHINRFINNGVYVEDQLRLKDYIDI